MSEVPYGEGARGLMQRARRAAAAWLVGREVEAARAESAAPPAEADAAVLIEALPDPVVLLEADGRIAALNGAARRRWGEARGLRFSAIIRHPALLDAATAMAGDGLSRTVDYVSTGTIEEQFECILSALDWRGRRLLLIVFRDRTAQINAERMRVDFVANASHELRTPLTALSMLIETIAGPARDNAEDRSRFLTMMQAQAERMRRLIDDLLALSRIELDERVPPSESADLAAAAREVCANAQQIGAARGVRFEISAPAGETKIRGERFQITQVAQNLIDNAIKFSPDQGAVSVEIGVAGDRDDALERAGRRWPEAGRISFVTPAPAAGKSYAYLRVEDRGPGIARHHLPRLGERFYRVEREEGRDRGGTGLGLAIVKHIVTRCRGGFVVESEPGAGSAFAVYLERAEGPAGE